MATQQDLQDLLRLLTVTRKMPMLQAMKTVKALQAHDLRSITQIAEATLEQVQPAFPEDEKAARPLHSACKAAVKRAAGSKRAGDFSSSSLVQPPPPKRARQGHQASDPFGSGSGSGGPAEMTPAELEGSLSLPLRTDEDRIADTVVETNRAPLVLAFAVELLRHTMPEQPLSSRLSLAQAVVSANSRSKAVSIGLERGPSAAEDGWGEGQPRVRVMGREVAVLKRGGYEWKGEETVGEGAAEGAAEEWKEEDKEHVTVEADEAQTETTRSQQQTTLTNWLSAPETTPQPEPNRTPVGKGQAPSWAASQPISLKKSTFIARATQITESSQRAALLRSLLDTHPQHKTATHNAWAYRLRPFADDAANRIREDAADDGETGCGDLMLRVMREAGAVDTMVVLTRWFGGVMLGPDRWRLMRNCVTSALAERLRKTGVEAALGGEAVWGLDLEAARAKSAATVVGGHGSGTPARQVAGVVGVHIHRPEAARNYLLKSFATAAASTATTEPEKEEEWEEGAKLPSAAAQRPPKSTPRGKKKKAKTQRELEAEKEDNLGLVLGALRLLFDSWADHLTPAELDRRAWGWYVAARPEVDAGPAGWGAKGRLRLADILKLRRATGGG